MYYLSAILLSFIIGLIRRGSIRAILEHPYKKWMFGFIGLLILIIMNFSYLFIDIIEPFAGYFPILSFVGYLLLMLMFIFNLDDIFSILIALGLTFDFIVTFINGGLMPVAQTVIDQMPQNLPLTQSIINATSVTYTIIQPGTLLSFLGVILPIPVLTRFLVMAGTLPGLSIGKTFILVGLLGLVQSAMKLPVSKKVKSEEPVEKPKFRSAPQPQTASTGPNVSGENPSRFDSITEELFFEDNPLPKDPLDKIFAGDMESQQTKHIDQINKLRKTKSETEDLSDLDREVELLTKPLGTGIINSKEIRERIINGEQEEVKEEINGFFSQEFKDKNKFKTEEIFTPEEPTVETSTIEILETPTTELEENKTKVFTPEESETVIPEQPIILLGAPEEEPEVEPMVNISPDIFMTLEQYNNFIESIDDKEFIQEFKYYLSQFRGEPVEKNQDERKAEVIITPVPETETSIESLAEESQVDSEEATKPFEIQETPTEEIEEAQTEEIQPIEVSEPESNKTKELSVSESKEEKPLETKEPISSAIESEEVTLEPVEIKVLEESEEPVILDETKELNQIEEINVSEGTEEEPKSRRRKRKKVNLIPAQEEKVRITILPEKESKVSKPVELTEEKVSETKVIIKIKEETVEEKEKVSELSSNELNSDKIEVQETQPEEESKNTETIKEESSEESQPVSDKLSDIIFEEEDVPDIFKEDIDLDLLEQLIEPDHYVSNKRGSFIQDEGSGYYVNKAYKEEKANMDKSEEEMLNVWAQVSQENQKRKMSRRRQSRSGFNTVSPFAQQETEQVQVEVQPEQVKSELKTAPQKSVNAMTDEERRAAGYEYVSIDVNGKTLSFWQKRN